MCYDNIEEIGDAVEALRKAKAQHAQALETIRENHGMESIALTDFVMTASEYALLHERRVEIAAARLNELVTPVKRVEPGDRAREIEALNSRRGLESQETRT